MVRILYISSVVPDTTSGGRLAMYRHFIVRQDFDLRIVSAGRALGSDVSSYEIAVGKMRNRLRRTRFARLAYNWDYIWNWMTLPPDVERLALQYRPDVVFTIPDNWHCGLAWQLAHRLGVPLVVNFQDLFPVSKFLYAFERPLPGVSRWLMKKFQFLNREAALVFYTSEGMRDWLGGHPNGHVLYPIGDKPSEIVKPQLAANADSCTIVYAGNCYGAYGRMLLELAYELRKWPTISLQIFAAGNDWPPEVLESMRSSGIYMGFRPFGKLKQFLAMADAFLTVMSFEEAEEPFVRTSFTTKWLDYAPYGKPIIAWAPEYSSAATFARSTGAGVVVNDPGPSVLLAAVQKLLSDRAAWLQAGAGSVRVGSTELNSERIHGLLRCEINRLVESRK